MPAKCWPPCRNRRFETTSGFVPACDPIVGCGLVVGLGLVAANGPAAALQPGVNPVLTGLPKYAAPKGRFWEEVAKRCLPSADYGEKCVRCVVLDIFRSAVHAHAQFEAVRCIVERVLDRVRALIVAPKRLAFDRALAILRFELIFEFVGLAIQGF